MKIFKNIFFFIALCSTGFVAAQGSLADYERAASFDTLLRNKVYNAPSSFNWLDKTSKFWYLNNARKGKVFMLADAEKGTQKEAFDHQKLAKALQSKIKKMVNPAKLPFDQITFTPDLKSVEFKVDSAKWRCNLSSYQCDFVAVEVKKEDFMYWGKFFDETKNDPVISPDSLWVAFIKSYNVFIRNRKTLEEFQMSYNGAAGDYYSAYIYWSPDSKKLAASQIRPGEKHTIHFIESSPSDQLQPKLCSRDYLKPGDALDQRRPQLFLIDEKKHVPVDDNLIQNQYSVSGIKWRDDSRSFTFEYNRRGHQQYQVIEVSAPSGDINVLINEESNTFIDYSGKRYRHDTEDGKEIIWASERDGWNHLYMYDGNTGKVKHQITKGNWVVRNVVHVDEKLKQIIFSAGGLDEGTDPYLLQYCRINFDGTGFTRLTNGGFNHVAVFSPDYKYFIDQYATPSIPPEVVLRRASDGKEIMMLQKADITALEKEGWQIPEVFTAKGRDGTTDIWGTIIRPSHFDPQKKYPIVEYIYAGPHGFHVPKNFYSNYRQLHSFAELGFIVVLIDGMGTSGRSKAFQDVCWKNLKDAGFPDRILWIKAAAEKYAYMDTTRVGIFGGSAGGQSSTGALLFHPEFYKVAVSACGCHDNRMDKIWWNEQWMGYPIGPHYAESSNVVNANRLRGKLMLILGELDDNVDPASTMQLANALIKNNKDFELVVIPGMGHSLGGDYGERKRRDFFVKHLLGTDPPSWHRVASKQEQ